MQDIVVKVVPVVMIGIAGFLFNTLNKHNELMPDAFVRLPPTAATAALTQIKEEETLAYAPLLPSSDPVVPFVNLHLTLSNLTDHSDRTAEKRASITLPETPAHYVNLHHADLEELNTPAPLVKLEELEKIKETSSDADYDDCTPLMSVIAQPAASLRVHISAPCNVGEGILVQHGAFMITEFIDDDGGYMGFIPALSETAVVTTSFTNGTVIKADTLVNDLANYEHHILLSAGGSGMELHVYENGAMPNQTGHISAARPGPALHTEHSHLRVIGDLELEGGRTAQVYTKPASQKANVPPIFYVENFVSPLNCEKDLTGEMVAVRLSVAESSTFTLSMPSCDALGDLVLLADPMSSGS